MLARSVLTADALSPAREPLKGCQEKKPAPHFNVDYGPTRNAPRRNALLPRPVPSVRALQGYHERREKPDRREQLRVDGGCRARAFCGRHHVGARKRGQLVG